MILPLFQALIVLLRMLLFVCVLVCRIRVANVSGTAEGACYVYPKELMTKCQNKDLKRKGTQGVS